MPCSARDILAGHGIQAGIELLSAPSRGKGSFLFLAAEFENAPTAGFGGLGAIGKRAEEVAEEACAGLLDHLAAKGSLDPHLADQVVPWLALCGGPSEFTTSRVTSHLLTNIEVVRRFMHVGINVEGKENGEGRVTISGALV